MLLVFLWAFNVKGYRLDTAVCHLREFLDGLTVEVSLALLHGPLQLPCEEPHVVVSLNAVAVRGDVLCESTIES